MLKRLISLIICFCFLSNHLQIANAQMSILESHHDLLQLPAPGTMVDLSPVYEPTLIKGITVHQDNPLLFDFIVNTGQSNLSGEALKTQGDLLIKYFFACLTVPEKDLWVNLSPYEKNKIVPQALGETALGRDLLAQDYILKQLTASLIYPEKDLGKEFWNKVYAKAQALYGNNVQIPINTFNKVWILADKASIYEHGQTVYVVDGHLKVMLEEDYLAKSKNNVGATLRGRPQNRQASRHGGTSTDSNQIGSQIIRDIILPEIEKEVNTGKNFASLRQIFNSLILATWYKQNLKEALLNQVYSNQNTVNGINIADVTVKEKIYQQYLQAYKKGVFNFIKEDAQLNGQSVPRKYFSGGFVGKGLVLNRADQGMFARTLMNQARGKDYAMRVKLNLKTAILASSLALGVMANQVDAQQEIVINQQVNVEENTLTFDKLTTDQGERIFMGNVHMLPADARELLNAFNSPDDEGLRKAIVDLWDKPLNLRVLTAVKKEKVALRLMLGGSFKFEEDEFEGSFEKAENLLEKLGQHKGTFKDITSAIDWLNNSIEPYLKYKQYLETHAPVDNINQLLPENFKDMTDEELIKWAKTLEGQRVKRLIVDFLYKDDAPLSQILYPNKPLKNILVEGSDNDPRLKVNIRQTAEYLKARLMKLGYSPEQINDILTVFTAAVASSYFENPDLFKGVNINSGDSPTLMSIRNWLFEKFNTLQLDNEETQGIIDRIGTNNRNVVEASNLNQKKGDTLVINGRKHFKEDAGVSSSVKAILQQMNDGSWPGLNQKQWTEENKKEFLTQINADKIFTSVYGQVTSEDLDQWIKDGQRFQIDTYNAKDTLINLHKGLKIINDPEVVDISGIENVKVLYFKNKNGNKLIVDRPWFFVIGSTLLIDEDIFGGLSADRRMLNLLGKIPMVAIQQQENLSLVHRQLLGIKARYQMLLRSVHGAPENSQSVLKPKEIIANIDFILANINQFQNISNLLYYGSKQLGDQFEVEFIDPSKINDDQTMPIIYYHFDIQQDSTGHLQFKQSSPATETFTPQIKQGKITDTDGAMFSDDEEVLFVKSPIEETQVTPGGIDLNLINLGMKISKDSAGGVRVSFDQTLINQIKSQGIISAEPVITQISLLSLSNLYPILGI